MQSSVLCTAIGNILCYSHVQSSTDLGIRSSSWRMPIAGFFGFEKMTIVSEFMILILTVVP